MISNLGFIIFGLSVLALSLTAVWLDARRSLAKARKERAAKENAAMRVSLANYDEVFQAASRTGGFPYLEVPVVLSITMISLVVEAMQERALSLQQELDLNKDENQETLDEALTAADVWVQLTCDLYEAMAEKVFYQEAIGG